MRTWFWPTTFAAFCIALAAAYTMRGTTGLAGMALGLTATSITVGGWWLAISQIAILSKAENAKGSGGTFWVVLAFLLKLPVFFVLGIVAQRIGGNAVPCFLGGLGLVYLAMIVWAFCKSAQAA